MIALRPMLVAGDCTLTYLDWHRPNIVFTKDLGTRDKEIINAIVPTISRVY